MRKYVHETPNFVDWYAQDDVLDGAEAAMIERLQPELAEMHMLDIGVGGGRTTLYFEPVVKQYTGVDYDANMIEAIHKRFPDVGENVRFLFGDARDLEFDDDTFDFVLFSGNGIDYVGDTERLEILAEAHRVGRPGTMFGLATHNIYSLKRVFREKAEARKKSRNPAQWLFLSLWFWLNKKPERLLAQPWAMVRDYAYFERLKWVSQRIWSRYRYYNNSAHYYIKPEAQIAQLESVGFKDVEVLTIKGELLQGQADFEACTDEWLYYLCKV